MGLLARIRRSRGPGLLVHKWRASRGTREGGPRPPGKARLTALVLRWMLTHRGTHRKWRTRATVLHRAARLAWHRAHLRHLPAREWRTRPLQTLLRLAGSPWPPWAPRLLAGLLSGLLARLARGLLPRRLARRLVLALLHLLLLGLLALHLVLTLWALPWGLLALSLHGVLTLWALSWRWALQSLNGVLTLRSLAWGLLALQALHWVLTLWSLHLHVLWWELLMLLAWLLLLHLLAGKHWALLAGKSLQQRSRANNACRKHGARPTLLSRHAHQWGRPLAPRRL